MLKEFSVLRKALGELDEITVGDCRNNGFRQGFERRPTFRSFARQARSTGVAVHFAGLEEGCPTAMKGRRILDSGISKEIKPLRMPNFDIRTS